MVTASSSGVDGSSLTTIGTIPRAAARSSANNDMFGLWLNVGQVSVVAVSVPESVTPFELARAHRNARDDGSFRVYYRQKKRMPAVRQYQEIRCPQLLRSWRCLVQELRRCW